MRVGFTTHSGWAAAVVVTAEPAVAERRRVLLTDRELPCRPFHEAAELDPAAAAEVVAEATRTAAALAERELDRLAAAYDVEAVGIVAPAGSVREDLPLAEILRAHGRFHAAEGELYRDVLLDAAAARGIPVSVLPRKDAAGRAPLGPARLTALGRALGPPWNRDHKDAVVAAVLATPTAS